MKKLIKKRKKTKKEAFNDLIKKSKKNKKEKTRQLEDLRIEVEEMNENFKDLSSHLVFENKEKIKQTKLKSNLDYYNILNSMTNAPLLRPFIEIKPKKEKEEKIEKNINEKNNKENNENEEEVLELTKKEKRHNQLKGILKVTSTLEQLKQIAEPNMEESEIELESEEDNEEYQDLSD